MEMHHKLRRDPNWHPSACNICGQLGHQAAQCSNGTINWRQLYGDEAFRLKQPLYESDLKRMKREKEVDLSALEKRAKEYAAMRLNGGTGPSQAAGQQTDANTTANGVQAEAGAAPGELHAKLYQIPAPAVPPPPFGESKTELPSGWAIAKDPQGRMYYWHTKTKKVTWDRPTADTPIDP